MSKAYDILQVLLNRCTGITTGGGYNTNLGLHAQIGQPDLNPDEVTSDGALVIYDTEESYADDEETANDTYMIRVAYSIDVHMRYGSANPVAKAHQMIDDVKTAVLVANDRTLGGLALDLRYAERETQYPDAAGEIVSARIGFYSIHQESYGSP